MISPAHRHVPVSPNPRRRLPRPVAVAAAALAITAVTALAGCDAGTSPAPAIQTLDEAAARVVEVEPRFTGITPLDPDLIGQASWWEGERVADGFRIAIQVGWGDCPAGCINRHSWTYGVTTAGDVTLLNEGGDPLPGGEIPPESLPRDR